MTTDTMLTAALDYAGHGVPVFPVWGVTDEGRCRCGRADCKDIGKHPVGRLVPRGFKDATTDEARIREWWEQEPDANIGTPTETRLVLDVDPRHGGDETLAELERQHGPLPRTPRVFTGGGGVHHHLAMPLLPLGNSVAKLGPGLDTRGAGGYVLLPPSRHASGRRYSDDPDRPLFETPLARVPEWMLVMLVGPPASPNGRPTTGATDWAARLAGVPEGERHAVACQIAGHFLGRRLPPAEVEEILLGYSARCTPPFSSADARRIVHDLAEKDRRDPDRNAKAPSSTVTSLEAEHLTDLGNARRLVRLFGQNIHYVPAWHEWFVWKGTHWQRDDTGQIDRFAKNVAASLYSEAGCEIEDGPRRRELAKHAMASESVRAIRGMVTLAETEPGIALAPGDLDVGPWLLNCANGTLDLRTGTLREHRRADLITKLVPVAYDPIASCPTFESFLARIFPDRPRLIRWIQRAVGYSLTGLTTEHIIIVCWGIGANGKTTLMQALVSLLADYAATLAAETLLARKGDAALVMNDLASLQGTRFAIAVESDMGRRLAEALVKQLTGGEAVKVKRLYANIFAITPTFKLWVGTNHKPVIRGTDHAIWRRIRLVPFEVVIPDEEQDHRLPEKLQAERPGILRWAVEGCLAWQQEGGLGTPEEVRQATEAYRAEMDRLTDFITERCVVQQKATVAINNLYEAYVSWANQEREDAVSKMDFGRLLAERGFKRGGRTKNERRWTGVRLRTEMDPPMDSDKVTDDDANSENFSQHTRVRESLQNSRHRVSPVTDPEPEGFVSAPENKG